MNELNRSRMPLLAGGILIFTAISQILLATDRVSAASASAGLVGLVVFGILVGIVRQVVANAALYEASERRLQFHR